MRLFPSLLYLLFLALLTAYCHQTANDDQLPDYLNLQNDVAYTGMEKCTSCHANVHESFIRTGMGQSFGRASKRKSAATYGAQAVVYDSLSDFYYHPFFQDSSMYIMEYRLENGDTVHKRIEKVSYIVGSGQHTNSHIIDINGYIFQAPITYYTQEKRWDMAPGFEGDNLRFSRVLTTECITCHNHYPTPVQGSLNKYAMMPSGIECERCHGPGQLHVDEKMAGHLVDTSKQIDLTIVNPRDLPRDRQMDLCQRCHLQGLAVLEDGKTFFDFKPGMRLSDVLQVYLPRYTDSHEKFIMASQADRLRLSPCYLESEAMSCLTCHHPHHSVSETPKEQYNNACLSCHKTAESCSVAEDLRRSENNNCIGCHMPRSGSIDIPHVNITDHYISKKTTVQQRVSKDQQQAIARFLGLQILTKASASPLEMARAYIAQYDKYTTAPAILDSAYHYLKKVNAPSLLAQKTRIHYYFARQDFEAICKIAPSISLDSLQDGWTFYRIGEAYFHKKDYTTALRYHQKATELEPFNLDFQEKLGATFIALQRLDEAKKTLTFVIDENPKRPAALTNFGFVKALQGDYSGAEKMYDQAIALDPDYVQPLLNKAAIRLLRKDKVAAKKLLEKVLIIEPENSQAIAIQAQLQADL